MMEQPQAVEGHDDAVLVAGGDHLIVPDGAARLHNGADARTAGPLDVVPEGEEGVGAQAHVMELGQPDVYKRQDSQ